MGLRKPLIVLRSNDNCFLDIIRACGRCGIETIPVIFTWDGAKWKSEESCYLKNAVVIANPAENEQQAVKDLCALGEKLLQIYKEKLIVISSSDTNLYLMQKNFNTFSPYFLQMGHGEFDVSCMNELRKDSSARLLKQGNVEIPLTYPVLSSDDIERAVKNMNYPCVYKPVLKDLVSSFQNSHNKKKAVECQTPEELHTRLVQEIRNGYELVVQEKIEFELLEDEVSCYMYVNKNGDIQVLSGQHKILEHPHPYGTGVMSVPFMTAEFKEIACKIARAYHWRGFMGIEFMKNKKNGRWVVIETNLRPWISINFQAAIGFNYLKALYEDFYNEIDEKTQIMDSSCFHIYRVNLMMLIQKKIADSEEIHKAMESIKEFIKEHLGRMIFSYYVYEDEGPGKAEMKELLERYPQEKSNICDIYKLIQENNTIIQNYMKNNGRQQ